MRVEQFKELAHTHPEQVAFSLSNYIQSDGNNFNNKQILAILNQLTITRVSHKTNLDTLIKHGCAQ
ncbi:hypothetical protein [Candidatus Arsenophonus triatominarum]|uniref:hypothetical protein n=1 Tax=Candidatus Arsenophonus triatominarum TaxID=57911 RepID=UPI001FDEEE52|nr:hypothetical protein [Candidatus Arsenophonus triatominarum]